ncbi:MAG: hypothetical protein COA78_17230 [Blastopirellula sp.]|nr:MAG: hypothetical protein COA78_17230 [Blastopirellula sp.]
MAKQDDYTRYTIRVPSPLYQALKREAGHRSVNAEIIERLQETVRQDRLLPEGLGYGDMVGQYEEAVRECDKIKWHYSREFDSERLEAMKDEILEAIRDRKKSS